MFQFVSRHAWIQTETIVCQKRVLAELRRCAARRAFDRRTDDLLNYQKKQVFLLCYENMLAVFHKRA